MKLLADENLPAPVIAALRRLGHDVLAVAESKPGASDAEVLATAVQQNRLLLTLDRDYGDLIFHNGRPAPAGVILFRLAGTNPDDDNRRMIQVLQSDTDWSGRLSAITEAFIRSRPFPAGAGRA
jgi:predicted nuclease of predicted toxin-antitoxin system